MSYVVTIDLSAKVEQWSKDTAVAFSGEHERSVLIKARTKRRARNWLQRKYPNRRPTFYQYLLFAILVYLLIHPYISRIEHVVVDLDYPGNKSEAEIKSWLLHFLHRQDDRSLRGGFIAFREVRGSRADILAREIYTKEAKPDREIALSEIRALFNQG